MKSVQMEPLSRKRQRRDHVFGWWPQFSIVLSSCKGPFKAWFELAVRTTLLRVRLLTKTECDVLLLTIWQCTYRNLETVCRTPLTKCSGGCRDPGGIIRCQYYWNLDITKGQGTTKIIHHTVSTVNINSYMKNCTKVRVQIPNTKKFNLIALQWQKTAYLN